MDAASFLERQPFTTLGALDPQATAAAIEIPVREAGRTISDSALELLVVHSKGHPYAVQLMAAGAWDASQGEVIEEAAARTGVERGVAVLQEQVYVARWRQMTPAQRRSAHAAALIEDRRTGAISSAAVAERLGATTKSVSRQRDELIRVHQIMASDGRDRLSFTQPGLAEWIRDTHDRSGR